MSRQKSQLGGARAPERLDTVLRDVVAALLLLSPEEEANLDSFNVSTCNDALQELVDHVNNPVGKPELTVPDLVGQIFLLHQHRAQLQDAKHQAHLTLWENSYTAAERENLQLRRELQRKDEEMTRMQENADILRAQIQSAQPSAEDERKEPQAGQASRAADTTTQVTHSVPDFEEVPSLGAASQNLHLEDPADQDESPQLWLEPQTPPLKEQVNHETHAEVAAPSGAVSNLAVPDTDQVSPVTHSLDAGVPPSVQTILSRTSLPFSRKGGDYSPAQSAVSGTGLPLASELHTAQSSHPPVSRTPPPPQKRRRRPHRHSDPSDKRVPMHCRPSNPTVQRNRKNAQPAWEKQVPPARGHKGDARVLELRASGNAVLALEGSRMPRARLTHRTASQRRRPPRKRGGQQNQGGDDSTHPLDQPKPRCQNALQPKKKACLDQNPAPD